MLALSAAQAFTHAGAFGNKFVPVIKMVEHNPGSSYENIVNTRCWVASFKVIGLLLPKKKKFLTIYGHVHLTWNI